MSAKAKPSDRSGDDDVVSDASGAAACAAYVSTVAISSSRAVTTALSRLQHVNNCMSKFWTLATSSAGF